MGRLPENKRGVALFLFDDLFELADVLFNLLVAHGIVLQVAIDILVVAGHIDEAVA